MYWLVWQSFVDKEKIDIESRTNNISIFTAIRKVDASTKEEAIGKFFLDTKELSFIKRIDPIECIEFDKLKTI